MENWGRHLENMANSAVILAKRDQGVKPEKSDFVHGECQDYVHTTLILSKISVTTLSKTVKKLDPISCNLCKINLETLIVFEGIYFHNYQADFYEFLKEMYKKVRSYRPALFHIGHMIVFSGNPCKSGFLKSRIFQCAPLKRDRREIINKSIFPSYMS